MRKTWRNRLPIVAGLLVMMIVLMAGECSVEFVIQQYTLEGSVVNVKADSSVVSDQFKGGGSLTLAGATITLTNVSGTSLTKTTEVSTAGEYTFFDVPNGRYTITGSKSGWIFVPQTFDVFEGTIAPQLYAYPSVGAGKVTIIMAWEEDDYDVDIHAVVSVKPTTLGDLPNSIAKVAFNNKTYSGTGFTVTLDRDVEVEANADIPRVETLSINTDSVAFGGDYQIRVYANAFKPGGTDAGALTGATATNKKPALVTLYTMLGNELYGKWVAPVETLETTIHFINIDLTTNASNEKIATIYSAGNYGAGIYRSIQ